MTALATSERGFTLAPYDVSAALRLERELGVSHPLAQILVRRGYGDPASAHELMAPSELHPASEFAGIERAVASIRQALAAGWKIVVHGDYDCDGVCATAVLVRALRSLGGEVDFYLPSRSEDGYGLAASTVSRLAARGTRLLITVDCGITAVDEVKAAQALGIEVVITDHHTPRVDGALPDCPIVHPSVCGYPCTALCGTAVAYKLAQALNAPTAEQELELVALATVADLMMLRGENRTLVRAGLAALANTARVGLRALMTVSRTDPSALDAGALGFRLAPRINAAGRMGRADGALELLLTDDAERAAVIAAELNVVNAERRAVEQRISSEALAQAQALGERPFYVLAGAGWHPGVVGIVASRVVQELHRPALVIALDPADPDAEAAGSGRSIPGFDLLAALDAAAPTLVRYGGHRAAAGITVAPARIAALRQALEAYAEPLMTDALVNAAEPVDAIVAVADCSLELAEELLALEPCGNGNPAPRLLVPGARIGDVRPLSEGRHARFTVAQGGVRASAVAWGCDGALPGGDGVPLDLSFRLERNVWQGVTEPRLVLGHVATRAAENAVLLGEPVDAAAYLAAVLSAFEVTPERALASYAGDPAGAGDGGGRTLIDRRGENPLVVVRDVAAAAGRHRVLGVSADSVSRGELWGELSGGVALVSYAALAQDPSLSAGYEQLVAIDPPAGPGDGLRLRRGSGYTQLAYGEAELRFALQIHELEYGLRSSLVACYRALREREQVDGEELGALLRGDGDRPRSPGLAARCLQVLTELGLAHFDPRLPSLALADTARTELDRSAAYRAYTEINEDGQRFLNTTTRASAKRLHLGRS